MNGREHGARFQGAIFAATTVLGLLAGAWPAQAAAGSVRRPAGSGWLSGISCTSPARCVAVGGRAEGAGRTGTLALGWAAGRWRILRTPPVRAAKSTLTGVSCRARAACVAVGVSTSTAGRSAAIAERWNGRAWRLIPPVSPAGAQGSSFGDVSCSSGCMAVGDYTDRSGTDRPLAERWNGTRWRLLATPSRAGQLDGVSCKKSLCMAVGDVQVTSATTAPLAESWNGRAWRVVPVPAPAGNAVVFTQDVSCAAPADCQAVGWYEAAAGAAPFTERWIHGRWHLLAIPAGAPANSVLDGISCPARASCVSVGSRNPAGLYSPLAQDWDGTWWRVLPDPGRTAETASLLNEVSCPRSDRCIAVGQVGLGKMPRILAELWDGSRWKALAGRYHR